MNFRDLALVLLLGLTACRDATAPFRIDDRGIPEAAAIVQLTFSPKHDHAPAWSRNGDSVYYSAHGFDVFGTRPGVLLSVPRGGGMAQRLFDRLQAGLFVPWIAAPVVSPAGDRIAFVFLTQVLALGVTCPPPSNTLSCAPAEPPESEPVLVKGRVTVRRFDATGPLAGDLSLDIDYDGRDFDSSRNPFGLPGVELFRAHPFQQVFTVDTLFAPRVSWAPDGTRLVLSDGLRLLIWNVGDAAAAPVPGTDDGAWPAWSPDGEWIAFTRYTRSGSSRIFCTCSGPFGITGAQERTLWSITGAVLTLVRPTTGELLELGEGEAPAWAPDGAWLYVRRGGQIWRLAADGSTAERVPNTDRGHEPAVSPDGGRLAFTRAAENGRFDVWVVALD
ncbi:MAG: PD40 domain-containing protein [Gemmatimonadetes bacterium]|nr:PD40 domain-containing protein [Gemmatimonadota bacterium]